MVWVIEEVSAGVPESRIVAIFSARESVRKIAIRTETIYWLQQYSHSEQARFSAYVKPTPNPYPATISKGRVICGGNPFLVAKRVDLSKSQKA